MIASRLQTKRQAMEASCAQKVAGRACSSPARNWYLKSWLSLRREGSDNFVDQQSAAKIVTLRDWDSVSPQVTFADCTVFARLDCTELSLRQPRIKGI